MRNNDMSTLDRLTAADPALAVTEDELARSREMSLAVMATDAEQLAVGGSIGDSHQRPTGSRRRVMAGFGLLAAAAAVVVGVLVTFSAPTEVVLQGAPAATQSGSAPQNDALNPPELSPLPEITGLKDATGNARIITGGNGKKAAVSTDEDVDVFMEALATGTLGLNSGGCIARIGADGIADGLVFPFGTTLTESGVLLPDGTPVNIGDDLAFGGGLTPGQVDLGECGRPGEAFLVQSWGFQP
ncbi:hypothetical protein QEH68_20820 [Paenarthrobacter sp. OM7]|uniref:hypothetical protein n=1 Tax=Paenarthrobacter sp. OM7 TaxID=3041264 RepID=UPI0024689B07|nr:hypothetical protein [Paenarthrobacter sp. OM7]WGM20426.1 hypothetical protein QEH68_20820 [Paenarthrobacter sp. OM7]